jgi:hypothetical protein
MLPNGRASIQNLSRWRALLLQGFEQSYRFHKLKMARSLLPVSLAPARTRGARPSKSFPLEGLAPARLRARLSVP